jgi:hypothetical protein
MTRTVTKNEKLIGGLKGVKEILNFMRKDVELKNHFSMSELVELEHAEQAIHRVVVSASGRPRVLEEIGE